MHIASSLLIFTLASSAFANTIEIVKDASPYFDALKTTQKAPQGCVEYNRGPRFLKCGVAVHHVSRAGFQRALKALKLKYKNVRYSTISDGIYDSQEDPNEKGNDGWMIEYGEGCAPKAGSGLCLGYRLDKRAPTKK
jgi:hypothetical protein